MNGALVFYLLTIAFSGALMLLLPHISPNRYLFAITVPPGFAAGPAGQAALRRYYRWVWLSLLLSLAVALPFVGTNPSLVGLAPALPMVAGMAAFLRERAVIRRVVPPQPVVQEADLTATNRLPRWYALALPAFALPIATAAWLRDHWDEIPQRFPVHWDAAGEPNRWVAKTAQAVYAPLLYGSGMMLFLLFMGLATFFGSRRAQLRDQILKLFVAVSWFMALMFCAMSVMPLVHVSAAWLMAPTLGFVVFALAWSWKMAKQPSEATPDSAWILGSVYYNPQDAAVFVQKRIGVGYTLNFGNRLAWLLIGVMLAIFVGLVWLLPR
jgi:uncharacterized membrane protein